MPSISTLRPRVSSSRNNTCRSRSAHIAGSSTVPTRVKAELTMAKRPTAVFCRSYNFEMSILDCNFSFSVASLATASPLLLTRP